MAAMDEDDFDDEPYYKADQGGMLDLVPPSQRVAF
jgi:hypothetical protein